MDIKANVNNGAFARIDTICLNEQFDQCLHCLSLVTKKNCVEKSIRNFRTFTKLALTLIMLNTFMYYTPPKFFIQSTCRIPFTVEKMSANFLISVVFLI